MKVKTERFTADPLPIVKNVTAKSNLELGVQLVAQAKLLAPVDTGQLRNSLSATSLKRENLLLNTGAGEKGKPLDVSGLQNTEVFAGTNSDHAVFQEFGTKYIPASPFMRPAEEIVIQKKSLADIYTKFSRQAMVNELKLRKVTLQNRELE